MSVVSIVFCIVIGGTALYAYRKMGEDNKIVESWAGTTGKILNSEVVRASGSYELRVSYEYTVDGVRYESNNVYRGNPRYGLGYPYDLDKVEFLKNTQVKYDPQNPSDSCLLQYDKAWYFIVMLLAGIVLSLIGWIGLLVKIFK